MTSITQKIPGFIGGISQQPDELKPVGTVRDAVNIIPDITKGVIKRPGGRLVQPLAAHQDGKWFNIYRDPTEQYIAKVNRDGTVEVYGALDGLPRVVTYSETPYSTSYPETPEVDSDSLPAYPLCDINAFNTAVTAYLTSETEYLTKESEYDIKLNEINLLEDQVNDVDTYYNVDDLGGDIYRVYEGIVSGRTAGQSSAGDDIEIGPTPPAGYKVRRGKRKEVNVTAIIGDADFFDFGQQYYDANIYEYEVYRDADTTGLDDLYDELDVIKAELGTLEATRTYNREQYEYAAAACGLYTNEYEQALEADSVVLEDPPVDATNTEIVEAEPVYYLPYLVHGNDDDIQILTLNDYTFFTNRTVKTSMSSDTSTVRASEAYIELSQVAYNKQYAMTVWEDTASTAVTEVSYTRVTQVSVNKGTWEDSDGTCLLTDIQSFTFTGDDIIKSGGGVDADKGNLVVQLETRGTPELKNPDKPENGYICKYVTTSILQFGGENWVVGDVVECEMAGQTYKITVEEVETYYEQGLGTSIPIFPTVTTNDGSVTLTATSILNDIKTELETETTGYAVEIIGNGVYITHPSKVFTITTPETQLMNITTDETNNVSTLPTQCKDGYIVKVANTDSDYDDYWAVFEAQIPGVDGHGSWIETVKPGIEVTFNRYSMPHQMVRQSDGTFVVTPIDWDPREAGDDETNPKPTFVESYINKIVFFRNRLTFLSGENAIASRPGDFFNFWSGSALAQVDNDPIDLTSASTMPSVLLDAIEVSEGLLCFGPNQQHLLTTDSEVFGPNTAKFSAIGTYRYSGDISPISLGSTIAFVSNAGLRSRLIELTSVSRNRESDINEVSKPVSDLMPNELNLLGESKDNSMVLLSAKGLTTVWGYRYFQTDRERLQSAWFKWELLGKLQFHCIMDDVYYTVLENTSSSPGNATIVSLQRYDLRDQSETAIVAKEQDSFQVHLDNYRVLYPDKGQYYTHLNQTYFKTPIGYFEDERLVAYALSPRIGDYATYQLVGSIVYPRFEVDYLGTWMVLDGDWSDTRLMVGYEYEMKVEFPTIYPTRSQETQATNRTDSRSSLIVHRVKLNFGQVGVYETTLTRKGREDYTQLYECKTMDGYLANDVAFDQQRVQTVPVYARNTDCRLTLKSSHPSPATLYSLEWEGDYSSRFYQRV